MKLGRLRWRAGHGANSWTVLPLLLVVVLVPTVGVLWFMSQAMHNEQLAVRQKLGDFYQAQLVALQWELELSWQARSAKLGVQKGNQPASRVFAERVRAGLADGVVVYDPSGRPAYPAPPRLSEGDSNLPSTSWRRAERQELAGQSVAAAALYAEIANHTTDRNLAARALLAQARCLVRAERKQEALAILTAELSRPEYATAADSQGRLIVPNAQLRVLELLGEVRNPTFQQTAAALSTRLNDYEVPLLPAAQRRFLMKQFATLVPDAPAFDTLPAEVLAARYLESNPRAPSPTSLRPSGLPEVWQLTSPGGTVVALFHQQGLLRDFESLIARLGLTEGATVELLPPGVEPQGLFLAALPAGGFLQDWQLVLHPKDQTLFATAASQQIKAYRLIGFLVVVTLVLFTFLVARAVERQLRLTRLKNDLLSTVSHELKTPLASMRLLVDTLLETGIDDRQRVREYLQLIAKENTRLSRLVDNFLTFSKMEQNRQSFEREPIDPVALTEAAAALVADRFHTADCQFEVQTSPDLPPLLADHDALVTVLLNLLDNAFKYSDEEKHIVLRSYSENGQVCFAVRDHGIGLSARAAGKIFERFYQVDQSLSRPGSGCGLGLSIVQFIVEAHKGSVDVDSRPGEGSTFTVRLPTAPEERVNQQETS
jgi:signal transduction histidine kinase